MTATSKLTPSCLPLRLPINPVLKSQPAHKILTYLAMSASAVFCLSILCRRPAGFSGLRPARGQDLWGLGPHKGLGASSSGAKLRKVSLRDLCGDQVPTNPGRGPAGGPKIQLDNDIKLTDKATPTDLAITYLTEQGCCRKEHDSKRLPHNGFECQVRPPLTRKLGHASVQFRRAHNG